MQGEGEKEKKSGESKKHSKNPVGRPKKIITTDSINLKGVVREPHHADNIVEMTYYNPELFKKLVKLLKAVSSAELSLKFDTHALTVVAENHTATTKINQIVYGDRMQLYYCKSPVTVCIKREPLEQLIDGIGKKNNKISFVLKEKNYLSVLYIQLEDSEYNTTDTYEIDILANSTISTEPIPTNLVFPLEFKMSQSHLKMKTKTIKKSSANMVIQKYGAEQLIITNSKKDEVGLAYTSHYADVDKLSLKSTLGPEDLICISIPISQIFPFTNSKLGDIIDISVSNDCVLMSTCVDNTINGPTAAVRMLVEPPVAKPA
jgi:hypothetical protein